MGRAVHRLIVVAILLLGQQALAAPVQSVSRLAFGPPDILFVADWRGGLVHAFRLPPAAPAQAGQTFNLTDLTPSLKRTLGATDVDLKDLAVRPSSDEAYIAVEYGPARRAAVLQVSAGGQIHLVDLARREVGQYRIEDQPASTLQLWDHIPGRSFTVTDMQWHDSQLYIAGLSNQEFSSTLRIVPFPFEKAKTMSIEMYHTIHNQIETRAPIRAMTFADIGGKPYLLAAYLCTPLVSIPLDALKDGAHVRAKTIAELGESGIPVDLLTYAVDNPMTHERSTYLLAVNLYAEAQSISVSEIEAANQREGLSSPVLPYGSPGPLKMSGLPLGSVLRAVNLSDRFLLALRRDPATGHPQLVTYNKAAMFRLSDFDESEFLLPGYAYTAPFQKTVILPMQNMLKNEEGYPDQVRR